MVHVNVHVLISTNHTGSTTVVDTVHTCIPGMYVSCSMSCKISIFKKRPQWIFFFFKMCVFFKKYIFKKRPILILN